MQLCLAAADSSGLADGLAVAHSAWTSMDAHAGCVTEGGYVEATNYDPPGWIELQAEAADISAAAIHSGLTSA